MCSKYKLNTVDFHARLLSRVVYRANTPLNWNGYNGEHSENPVFSFCNSVIGTHPQIPGWSDKSHDYVSNNMTLRSNELSSIQRHHNLTMP